MASHQANDRPIIVVGCPRSGTTMLQLMLHAHPRIAVPPENRFVLPAYHRRAEFGNLEDAANRRRLGEWIVGHKGFGDFGLDRAGLVEEIVAAPGTLGSAIGTVLRAYSARFGKPRWGDKRPAYLRNLDIVLRLFPDAQVVNIVRDGRDCVASLKEMPWLGESFEAIVGSWARAVDEGDRWARRLDASSYHQLRYEDLVTDPEPHLRALCAFLGEDYDPAMAKPGEQATVAVPAYKTWHSRTRGEVTTERVQSWQHRLTAEELALCETALASRLRSCGYELSGAGSPGAAARARYEWATVRHRLAPARRAAVALGLKLRPEPPVAARLTSRQGASVEAAVPAPSAPVTPPPAAPVSPASIHAESRASRAEAAPALPPAQAQTHERAARQAQPPA
ncbi:sulfotransferase family protein [Spirilliplanes yamanashiensis]|uniref:Sulfotransferase n=1 Tax=Spirilliplanes yamanashiensis TaxID=42233 RepID=A0A8J4DID7_9ACTN|nr:sulfotransferase [Spirilliplanes yamanashiensis]MDP9814400.1 hypothetical protein [Spirilliplanes yamanashiensis]GIJ02053.1 hypothetical protein Sya03_14050 [Spirilliplanes yamanashiensis]